MAKNEIALVNNFLDKLKPDFDRLAVQLGVVNFETEKFFAIEHLRKDNKLLNFAVNNANDFKLAILSVANTGLSLCPHKKEAYLIVRKGSICVDFSYRGLYKLAVEDSVKCLNIEAKKQNDFFEYQGLYKEPIFRPKFGSDRGDDEFYFCVAKLNDGTEMVTVMEMDELYKIRDNSESYKAYKSKKIKSTPWVTWFSEMCKKSVLRRADKIWPKSNDRLMKAFSEMDRLETPLETVNYANSDQIQSIKDLVEMSGRTQDHFFKSFARILNRDFDFDNLTNDEAERCINQLRDIIRQENKNNNNEVPL